MRLYHMTSIGNAVSILRAQEMHPGSHGLCGPGIYFGPDPVKLSQKARCNGVTLCAEVDLGNVMLVNKERVSPDEDWANVLDRRGCDSVRCTGLRSGDEYVVYEAGRVKSIRLYSAWPHRYTGRLQVSADGISGTGQSLTGYLVSIVAINERPSWPYPVRLGDSNSNQLGWAEPAALTVIRP
jgi:hypothetical protein